MTPISTGSKDINSSAYVVPYRILLPKLSDSLKEQIVKLFEELFSSGESIRALDHLLEKVCGCKTDLKYGVELCREGEYVLCAQAQYSKSNEHGSNVNLRIEILKKPKWKPGGPLPIAPYEHLTEEEQRQILELTKDYNIIFVSTPQQYGEGKVLITDTKHFSLIDNSIVLEFDLAECNKDALDYIEPDEVEKLYSWTHYALVLVKVDFPSER